MAAGRKNRTEGAREEAKDVLARLQESRRFMAQAFEEGDRADAAVIASLERKADGLARLLAAACKRAA